MAKNQRATAMDYAGKHGVTGQGLRGCVVSTQIVARLSRAMTPAPRSTARPSPRCVATAPRSERYDAKRQIGEQINGREHAAASLGGDRAVDQRQATKEKQAVADAAHCRRGEENPQLVPGDGKGEQPHAGGGGHRPQHHRWPRTKAPRHNPEDAGGDRKE